jgi:hypothetical protein
MRCRHLAEAVVGVDDRDRAGVALGGEHGLRASAPLPEPAEDLHQEPHAVRLLATEIGIDEDIRGELGVGFGHP